MIPSDAEVVPVEGVFRTGECRDISSFADLDQAVTALWLQVKDRN